MKNKIIYNSFYVSIAFHLTLIILIFFITNNKTYIEINNELINIQNITTVDAVGLPNILKKDIPLINQKKIEQKKEDMVLKQTANIDRLKAISNLRNRIDEKKYLEKVQEIKGLGAVFKGQANLGISSNKNLEEEDEYFIRVKNKVNSNWNLPSWLSFEGKKILIRVYIDYDGNIIKIEQVKSSEDSDLDNSAITAIKNSEPFIPAPDKFKDSIKKQGILFSFP